MASLYGRLRRLGAPALVLIAMLAAAPAASALTSGVIDWGDNSGGELGNGTLTPSTTPVAVSGVSGEQQVAAGYRFNLALVSGGTVLAWGENQFGQLGDGTTTISAVPVAVKGLSGVTAVAAGGGHSLALLSNGTVMAWGNNRFGQLGDGTTTSHTTPVAVKGLTGVTAIAAGQVDSLALLSNGTVMAWGDNRDGELGDGTTTTRRTPVAVQGLSGVTAIAAGGFFNLALLGDTDVEAWGEGIQGQLGNGQITGSATPVAVQDLTGVTQISAGDGFGLAVLGSGALKAWGDNSFDELGDPAAEGSSDVPVTVPDIAHVRAIAAGGLSSLALLSSGAVDSWGDNAVGQLGNGTTNDAATPTRVPGLSSVTAIANGADHALAIGAGAGGGSGTPSLTPWSTVLTPNPGVAPPPNASDVFFSAVSATSADDAWAVGQAGSFPSTPMSEHWDGTAWAGVSMPMPAGGTSVLNGVEDVAPGDAWAVGTTTSSSTDQERTLIEHWNGTSWKVVPSPNPDGGTAGNDELEAVAGTSASDIWAVGQDFENINGAQITMLFEHFNGSTWTAAASPLPNGDDFALGVTAISPTDAWAVGTNGFQGTLAAHWDGTQWTIVPTPFPMDGSSPTNQLTAVTARGSDDVWASGYEANVDDQNFDKPYLLHWNGSAWKLVLAPNMGTEGSLLRGISALSANDIWAVGQTQQSDGAIYSLTQQYNGSKWSTVASPDPGQNGPIVDNSLAAVTSPGGGLVWALGAQDTLGTCCLRTLALRNSSG